MNREKARAILRACALYFVVCGVSASWFPASWLWASGLPTPVTTELSLTFGVIGAFMVALGLGAALASRDPVKHYGLIATLAIANLLDFMTTVRTVAQGDLPTINGILFILVAALWSAILFITWRYCYQEATAQPS